MFLVGVHALLEMLGDDKAILGSERMKPLNPVLTIFVHTPAVARIRSLASQYLKQGAEQELSVDVVAVGRSRSKLETVRDTIRGDAGLVARLGITRMKVSPRDGALVIGLQTPTAEKVAELQRLDPSIRVEQIDYQQLLSACSRQHCAPLSARHWRIHHRRRRSAGLHVGIPCSPGPAVRRMPTPA